MSEKIRLSALTMTIALTLVAGCGKGQTNSAAGTSKLSAQADSTASAETTLASEPAYKTSYDAKAVYGMNDLPGRGSYLKLDFNDLTADQLNRVIHRLRTEDCTCGCKGDLIDQCLVNDPACETAVTLAKQIIREEKMKS